MRSDSFKQKVINYFNEHEPDWFYVRIMFLVTINKVEIQNIYLICPYRDCNGEHCYKYTNKKKHDFLNDLSPEIKKTLTHIQENACFSDVNLEINIDLCFENPDFELVLEPGSQIFFENCESGYVVFRSGLCAFEILAHPDHRGFFRDDNADFNKYKPIRSYSSAREFLNEFKSDGHQCQPIEIRPPSKKTKSILNCKRSAGV